MPFVSDPFGLLIVAVLQTVVLRNRGGVNQMHGIAMIHQPIDQPVPVVGRLHRHADQLFPVGFQITEQTRQIVGPSALQQGLAFAIHDGQHAVAGMQIDSCVK